MNTGRRAGAGEFGDGVGGDWRNRVAAATETIEARSLPGRTDNVPVPKSTLEMPRI
jgi:hypothetical protein